MKVVWSFACLLSSFLMFAQNVDLGHWEFEGDLMDASSLRNDGVSKNETVYIQGRNGDLDSAIYFNGDDDVVEIPHFSEFNRDTLTISFWFKPENVVLQDDASFPYRVEFLFYKGLSTDGSKSTHNFGIHQLDNTLGKVGLAVSKTVNQVNASTFIDSIGVNEWHNLVSVLTGKKHEVYLDGELIDTKTLSDYVSKNTTSITLGNILGGSDRCFKGAIDDLKFSSKPWSQEDVYDEVQLSYCNRVIYDTVTVYKTIYDTVKVMDTLVIDFDDEVLFANEKELSGTVKVFPNPSSDKVNVTFSNYLETVSHTLELVNSKGNAVYSNPINSQDVEISLLEAGGKGVYYLIIKNDKGEVKTTKKIVVE